MSTPVKAQIMNLGTGESVSCQFNPKELKLTKKNSWKLEDAKSQNTGILNFSGGTPTKLTLELLFDTTSGGDVRPNTNTLLKMMQIDKSNVNSETELSEPPRVRFVWGRYFSFEAVITNINLTFKMFRSAGTPIRATAKTTFQESKDGDTQAPQNPTSRSEARRVRMVLEGQTLSWIAYQEYGNPKHWRHIAQTNGITNPMSLRSGQVLNIVPLP